MYKISIAHSLAKSDKTIFANLWHIYVLIIMLLSMNLN